MVVAEGLFEYLTEEDVRTLLNRLTDRFPHGQVAFDVMSSSAVRSGRTALKARMGVEHKWAVDDVRAVDALDKRLKRVSSLSLLSSCYMPLGYRMLFRSLSIIPRFRGMIRLLRYEF